MTANIPLLSCQDIYKSFGDNHVLKGINLDVFPGDVLALIGGNGAGKSTLMKIIVGIYSHDKGKLVVEDYVMKNVTPAVAQAKGIYYVPQEPMLFPNMTIEQNVLIGLPGKDVANRKRLKDLLKNLNWDFDISRQALTLSIAEQQLIEIIRGLMHDSKILILDEPTSSLTFNDIKSLFKMINDLKKKGVGIIYITHRLEEVFEIATKIVIMRDGRVTLSGPVSDFDNAALVKALTPDEQVLEKIQEKADIKVTKSAITGKEVLRIDKLSGNGFADLEFGLHSGEILGLAGVVGAGRTEFANTVFGRDEVLSGKAFLNDQDITGLSTRKVIRAGLTYVPEDRFQNGIFRISEIGANMTSSSLPLMGRFFINKHYEEKKYEDYQKNFRILTTGVNQEIGDLSGGNQQKVVLAKSLVPQPKVVILDEPTRGVDAGAREDVYKIIYQLKSQGVAILVISSDMQEIIQVCDRALVMYRGRIIKQFVDTEITQNNLMNAAFGLTGEEAILS
jgi:AI-2 transport system ATP-binding protein